MIISINAERAFNKIQHPWFKKVNSWKNRRKLPQLDKLYCIYQKFAINVTLNGKRLNPSPIRSGKRQVKALTALIQHHARSSSQRNKKKKKKMLSRFKRHLTGKEWIKLSLFTELISKFNKVSEYKLNI